MRELRAQRFLLPLRQYADRDHPRALLILRRLRAERTPRLLPELDVPARAPIALQMHCDLGDAWPIEVRRRHSRDVLARRLVERRKEAIGVHALEGVASEVVLDAALERLLPDPALDGAEDGG